jgi:hypothetical protein
MRGRDADHKGLKATRLRYQTPGFLERPARAYGFRLAPRRLTSGRRGPPRNRLVTAGRWGAAATEPWNVRRTGKRNLS